MIYVSLVEIFQKSIQGFSDAGYDSGAATTFGTTSFFGGVVFMFLCDLLVHKIEEASYQKHLGRESAEREREGLSTDADTVVISSTHLDGEGARVDEWVRRAEDEIERERGLSCAGLRRRRDGGDEEIAEPQVVTETKVSGNNSSSLGTNNVLPNDKKDSLAAAPEDTTEDRALIRMGLATALSIAIHNFPEGLATFVATVDDTSVGATLAVAIAIHNIPEGLCVAIPIYYATGNRRKAFMWGLLSGVTEPIGAALGWAILADSMNDAVYGSMFGIVSGMMVMIVIKELLPVAHRYDPKDSVVTYSFVFGMFIMALSLVLFVAI